MTDLELCAVIIVIQLGCIIVMQLIWGYIQIRIFTVANKRTVAYRLDHRDWSELSLQQMTKALEHLKYLREKA